MQPYIFPYIGYFQLLIASDIFVLYNDVNWINRGWINRNRILINNQPHTITIPCKKTSQNKLINEIEINIDDKVAKKLLHTIDSAYKKAPHFNQTFKLIESVFEKVGSNDTIDSLAETSLKLVLQYLNIHKKIVRSSECYPETKGFSKADRLIAICKTEHCSNYVNAAGGVDLYSKDYFKKQGINLAFLATKPHSYKQFTNEFIANLSIIDILMFNDIEQTKTLLHMYELN
ncbi:MAG: WbqC family protein [Bacteroidales bacterium]|nr:WbqC family protein [Bacteroidales bacterium]